MEPTPTLTPARAVPKAGDPNVATLPTLDSPFIRQLCRCLRTGKSTTTMHDLSRWGVRAGRRGGRSMASKQGGTACAVNQPMFPTLPLAHHHQRAGTRPALTLMRPMSCEFAVPVCCHLLLSGTACSLCLCAWGDLSGQQGGASPVNRMPSFCPAALQAGAGGGAGCLHQRTGQ